MLETLSPGQRQAVMFGAPVVAVFALISVLQKRNAPATTAAATSGGMPATMAPTTDAIGTGQLADFESMLTSAITQLAQQVSTLPTTDQIVGALPDIPPATTIVEREVPVPAAPAPAAPAAGPPLSYWQAQPWYGTKVDWTDPNVPTWYKMGFLAPTDV